LDALVGNWDVAGASLDNILVDKDGKLWRIDNGGSLSWRAMGSQKKGDEWNGYITDLWTMRDSSIGGAAAHSGPIFNKMSWYDIMDQGQALVDKGPELLAKVPAEERPILHARIEHMRDMVNTSKAMRLDQYDQRYPDSLHKHTTSMNQAGLKDRLPKKMKSGSGDVYVKDENGKSWDNLRGRDSAVSFVDKYMKEELGISGGQEIVGQYMSSQGGSSWGGLPMAMKYHNWLMRGKPADDKRFWLKSRESGKREYEDAVSRVGGEEKFNDMVTAWRGFVFESVRNVDFKYNHPDEGYVQLARTEPSDAFRPTGAKPNIGKWQEPIPRGTMDSSSIYKTVRVGGNQLTLQKVPYHRLIGHYWHSRYADSDQYPFLGDGENEFVGDFNDLEYVYVGTVGGGENLDHYWAKAAVALGEPELDPNYTKVK
jgi:hypothetical protein